MGNFKGGFRVGFILALAGGVGRAEPLPLRVIAANLTSGNDGTNAPRKKPYDRVLADADLEAHASPAKIAAQSFPGGLVFDSRILTPIADAAPNVQHMAVIRDFLIP